VWKVTQAVGEGAGAAVGGAGVGADASGAAPGDGAAPRAGGAGASTAAVGEPRHLEFERTRGIDFTFAPRATTVLDLELESPGKPVWDRPDLGIGGEVVVP
jgi:hypothetical protein